MSYSPEAYDHSIDLSNYAAKSDLKGVAGVDASKISIED